MKRILFLLAVFLPVLSLMAEVKISGTVYDDRTGEPIIGVSILEIGTSNGTISDFDGNFWLTVSSKDAQLSFQYKRYVTQIVPVQEVMHIRMKKGKSKKTDNDGSSRKRSSRSRHNSHPVRPHRDPAL